MLSSCVSPERFSLMNVNANIWEVYHHRCQVIRSCITNTRLGTRATCKHGKMRNTLATIFYIDTTLNELPMFTFPLIRRLVYIKLDEIRTRIFFVFCQLFKQQKRKRKEKNSSRKSILCDVESSPSTENIDYDDVIGLENLHEKLANTLVIFFYTPRGDCWRGMNSPTAAYNATIRKLYGSRSNHRTTQLRTTTCFSFATPAGVFLFQANPLYLQLYPLYRNSLEVEERKKDHGIRAYSLAKVHTHELTYTYNFFSSKMC